MSEKFVTVKVTFLAKKDSQPANWANYIRKSMLTPDDVLVLVTITDEQGEYVSYPTFNGGIL